MKISNLIIFGLVMTIATLLMNDYMLPDNYTPDSVLIIASKDSNLKAGSHWRIYSFKANNTTIKISNSNKKIWWGNIEGHYGIIVDHFDTREFYPMNVIKKVSEQTYFVVY